MSASVTFYKILALSLHPPDEPLFKFFLKSPLFRDALTGTFLEELRREHTRLFSLTVAGGLPPYETEYGHKEIFFKTERLADISGFYRAFGLEISEKAAERIDFIGAELELMDWLVRKETQARFQRKKEEAEICQEAQSKFMGDHLGRWAGYFGDQIAKNSPHPFYQQVGRLLRQLIEEECGRLNVQPDRVTGWEPEPISTKEFDCGIDC